MPQLKPLTVIGLNSGTSMDGIDAAVFHIVPLRSGNKTNGASVTQRLEVEMLESLIYPIEPVLKKKMQTMVASGHASLEDICRLNAALGETFAKAAISLMKRSGLSRNDVHLIGSHGQTIWHAPQIKRFGGVRTHSTLQLGEPAIIAARTGVPVVGDFRVQDMAMGGQGAPLVAFADEVLFGSEGEPTAILNIGGIANITVLDSHGQAVSAFDTGPGNMIIDRIAHKLFDADYDEGGKVAGGGKVNQKWLGQLLSEPYFKLPPPKTTGRELFGNPYADKLIDHGRKEGLKPADIMATATALTAASIADSYKDFIESSIKIDTLVLGGGGAENATLCKLLAQYWPHKLRLKRHEDYGVSTKFKEALLFALLAYTTHFGIRNNVPRCTGASQRVCLGKICRS
jgi:anhydro-N-acetylmuramic acid kinase